MRYIVKLGYNEFVFHDPKNAMLFAETAKTTYKPRNRAYHDDDLDVTVTFVNDEETENEETEEE